MILRLRFPAAILAAALATAAPALAQTGPGGPPAVGVVPVRKQPVTQTAEFVGRIQAINRVNITARVTAFLEERLFVEGTEVKEGDLLYRLERAPFEAAVAQQSASVAQTTAILQNASIALGRAQALLNTPAGQRSVYDDARAQQASQAAQLASAQAQLKVAQINLDYTEIHAPISGKISQTQVTPGNVVSPSSGTLVTIVSQDPMYVEFPISVRSEEELENKYANQGGLKAVAVKIRLPDGSIFNQTGRIDFKAPTVAQTTDTITLRAIMADPPLRTPAPGQPTDRPLTDGMFVTVMLSGLEPVEALVIPRSAILADQQGFYVYVVGANNVAEQRRIATGQNTPSIATITSGLKEGELVVVDGVQRVRPGQPVTPGPATPTATSAVQTGMASSENASGTGPASAAGTSPANTTPTSGAPGASAAGSGATSSGR